MFDIETEFHFLLECETFDDLWLNTFEQDVLKLRNIDTFNRIMSSNDDKLIYKIAHFLTKVFERRKVLVV